MKTERFGTILIIVIVFSIASSFSGYALEPTIYKAPTTVQPQTTSTTTNVISDSAALTGAIPIVFSNSYGTSKHRPAILTVPRSPSPSPGLKLGFNGTITKMTVVSYTMYHDAYTLFVNGKPTSLSCDPSPRLFIRDPNIYLCDCSVNGFVPITVNDFIKIESFDLPDSITLMVQMK